MFFRITKKISLILFFKKIPPLFLTTTIVVIMFLPESYSWLTTVLVVLFSTILITSLKRDTLAYKFFANPKVVYIGKLSYSLYLWHWGVLTISRWTIGVYWWTFPFQILLILIISIFSYRFIETPFRKANWHKKRLRNWILNGGLIASISGVIFLLGKPFKGYLFLGKTPIYYETRYNNCHLTDIINEGRNIENYLLNVDHSI